MSALIKIRAWIRANILGPRSRDYRSLLGPPQTLDEKLTSAMEDTEFVSPPLINPDRSLNDKFVAYWVNKLMDLVLSGLGAAFLWVVSRMTGKKPPPEDPAVGKAEILIPAALWAGCFVLLQIHRAWERRKARSRANLAPSALPKASETPAGPENSDTEVRPN